MAFIMGGKMACIFLLVVPVLGFGLYMVIRTAMPLFRKVFHKYDELNNSIQENIKGMRVVKSYVREEFEKEKFDRAAGDVCEDFTKAEKILAWNNPLMQFSLYTVMIFVLTVYNERSGFRCRTVFRAFNLQLSDLKQSDDAFDGICHGHACK